MGLNWRIDRLEDVARQLEGVASDGPDRLLALLERTAVGLMDGGREPNSEVEQVALAIFGLDADDDSVAWAVLVMKGRVSSPM